MLELALDREATGPNLNNALEDENGGLLTSEYQCRTAGTAANRAKTAAANGAKTAAAKGHD